MLIQALARGTLRACKPKCSPRAASKIRSRSLASAHIFEPAELRRVISQNPIAFRDACECTQCIDQSTRQRDFSVTDIPLTISPDSVVLDHDHVSIRWQHDIPRLQDHVSTLSKARILEVLDLKPSPFLKPQPCSPWNQQLFRDESQSFTYNDLMTSDTKFRKALLELSRFGLVFVKDCPHDENVVKMLANRIGILRNSFYGESWDVRSVPAAKNVAYTSKFLDFHMDLLYMLEPPGLQLLHCLENTCSGGESQFVDTSRVISGLAQSDPAVLDVLSDTLVRYRYENDGYFFTDVKPIVNIKSSNHLTFRPAGFTSQETNQEGTIPQVYWSPPFMDSFFPRNKDLGLSHHATMLEAMKTFDTCLHDPRNVYEDKLDAGTCAIFDNLRVLHARNAFDMNSGNRWLKGAYADRQDFYSKLITRPP